LDSFRWKTHKYKLTHIPYNIYCLHICIKCIYIFIDRWCITFSYRRGIKKIFLFFVENLFQNQDSSSLSSHHTIQWSVCMWKIYKEKIPLAQLEWENENEWEWKLEIFIFFFVIILSWMIFLFILLCGRDVVLCLASKYL